MNLEFSGQIFEKYSNIKFHENLPMGAELFHAEDGRTDMTKLIVAFRKFSNASKKLVWVRRPSVVVVDNVTCKSGVGRLACNAWLKYGELVYIQQVSCVWWLYIGGGGVLNCH